MTTAVAVMVEEGAGFPFALVDQVPTSSTNLSCFKPRC